jgi:hypothetical protein
MKGHAEVMAESRFSDFHSGGDAYGKGIHGEAQCDSCHLNKTHWGFSFKKYHRIKDPALILHVSTRNQDLEIWGFLKRKASCPLMGPEA